MSTRDENRERWQFELIDLTRPLTEEVVALMFGDLSDEKYSAIPIDYIADWSNANGVVARFSLFDHAGTHMDAPIHTVERRHPALCSALCRGGEARFSRRIRGPRARRRDMAPQGGAAL